MTFTRKERLFSRAVVAALVIALIVLALLQYRWSGEVSAAATARMKASLQSSMMDFRQDLSREFATICLEMQPGPNSDSIDELHYVRQLRHWEETSSHPGLIAAVYLWQLSSSEQPALRRLAPGMNAFK